MPLLKPYPGPRAPEVDQIWVVVPFSRPRFSPRVLSNFARQRFRGKRLLVVANGPAVASGRITGAEWITSEAHPSHAKNEALSYIKKHGGGFFATMDDDDYYGPGYLDEVAGYAKSYEGLGKQWHFVSIGEGGGLPAPASEPPQLILCNRSAADHDASWLTGGTISGWSENAEEYIERPGEDLDWCRRMQHKGARLRGLSIYHYLYRRSYAGAEHAWQATRQAFLRSVGGYAPLEFPLTEHGKIDFELVDGEKTPTEYRVLGQPRFIPVAQTHPDRLPSGA